MTTRPCHSGSPTSHLPACRVYLTVEMTDRKANDANLALSGKSTSFGLRFEF